MSVSSIHGTHSGPLVLIGQLHTVIDSIERGMSDRVELVAGRFTERVAGLGKGMHTVIDLDSRVGRQFLRGRCCRLAWARRKGVGILLKLGLTS